MGGSSVPHARSAWPGPPSEALPGLAGVSLGAWGEGCANLDNCKPTACTGDVIPVRRGTHCFIQQMFVPSFSRRLGYTRG